jgi:hypothetical protein
VTNPKKHRIESGLSIWSHKKFNLHSTALFLITLSPNLTPTLPNITMIFNNALLLSTLLASSSTAFVLQTGSRKTMAPTFSYLGSLGDGAPRATQGQDGRDVQTTSRNGPHFANVADSRTVRSNSMMVAALLFDSMVAFSIGHPSDRSIGRFR